MAVDFSDFSPSSTIPTSAYFVGYEKNESGGERKWTYGTLRSTLSSQIASGSLYPTGGGNDKIFWENSQNVTTNYTITNGKNAMTAGPVTIDAGVSVTVPAGSVWTVV
jgi:hypothetical protein